MKIPEGYQQVMPYLIVKDAAGFMEFMKNVFGAQEKFKMMRDENIFTRASRPTAGLKIEGKRYRRLRT